MAASDPTAGVPTPTGVLQGAAAFSWDGSTWQPAGRASVGVGTPTGVLRGIAPFSSDGTNWQPVGQTMQGVATPTGVLEGVAVHTWSGSAWVPPGGSSTPSGALRGVAAFNWDGTAWQPAGQAGPTVATPYGVLDGVAMFNWTGTGWAAVQGPSLNISFMAPGALDARVTFTRASTATYFNASGVMQTAAVNAPRWDYDPGTLVLRGLLLEEARANSAFPSVPTVGGSWVVGSSIAVGGSVVAPDGTTSTTSLFYATDTTNTTRAIALGGITAPASTPITISVFFKGSPNNAYIQVNSGGTVVVPVAYYDLTNGTAVVGADLLGTITGKSATLQRCQNGWWRATFTFTLPAGSGGNASAFIGPCTVVSATGDNRSYTGVVGQGIYVWGLQGETGAFPTSYIPTVSAAVTRTVDSCVIQPANMGWFVPGPASWFAAFTNQTTPTPSSPRIIGYPVANGKAPLFVGSTNLLGTYDGAAAIYSANTLSLNVASKAVSTWAAGTGNVCLNGAAVTTGAMTGGYADAASNGLALFQTGTAAESLTGYLRSISYWPRALSNAEMQSVTT